MISAVLLVVTVLISVAQFVHSRHYEPWRYHLSFFAKAAANDTCIASNHNNHVMVQGRAGEILPELFDVNV